MAKTKRYPGHIEERGDGYRVILRVAGERHSFTLPAGTRRKEAEAFAVSKEKELREQVKRRDLGLPELLPFTGRGAQWCEEHAGKGQDPVPMGFLDKYELDRVARLAENSKRSYRGTLRRARRFFDRRHPGIRVDEVRPAHVREYLTWRSTHLDTGEGIASNTTVARERSILSAAFTYAVELELRDVNPVRAVPTPKVTKRDPVILSPAQYERLLAACEPHYFLWLYVLVLGETGARADSEAVRLRFDDVDVAEGFIWIPSTTTHRTKSGKGRWVPMTERLQAAMREHFARYRLATYRGKRPEYIFHHTRDRRRVKAGERIRGFRRTLPKAVRRAKLPEGFVRHDLRHRRVTSWLAEGKDLVLVKEAMGHSSVRVTMGYTHLVRENLRPLVEDRPERPEKPDRLRELSK